MRVGVGVDGDAAAGGGGNDVHVSKVGLIIQRDPVGVGLLVGRYGRTEPPIFFPPVGRMSDYDATQRCCSTAAVTAAVSCQK